ncbi:hypothetical protein NKR19_g1030 [Coniochaeta hoffmannii]|uniref:Uncharacterized protein n=1 Tax=Coniochaeta hoffmannii TaxID=91930 RepID=A0AA38RZ60_9PEZI|nr:hypothetical protein NKR19_g1030 [Coniochaeta hoffmannii]
MGIPVILATAAACGSIVTTMKSGWELSRMIRQKRDRKRAEEDAVRVYRSLRRALHSGRVSNKEFDHWFEKFLVAESENNLAGLREIRAHLRIVNDNSDKRSRRYGSLSRERPGGGDFEKRTQRSCDGDRRQKSVRLDRGQMYYVPDPPQWRQDVEWPQSARSIEYSPLDSQFPEKGLEDPDSVPLARLQRSASVSYQPSHSPPKLGSRASESATRHEQERGRSRRRQARDARANADADSSDGFCHEKLGYRSRR